MHNLPGGDGVQAERDGLVIAHCVRDGHQGARWEDDMARIPAEADLGHQGRDASADP